MGIRIALAGNPNCGKTTMFNSLTGANQYVGNWPGVTVEKKEGKYARDKEITITDLPGVYSLSPYSPEEVVSRDYLMSGEPDVVVNLIDATNLERNLYLTTQIIDLGIPVVIALNMADLIEKNGDKIDVATLSTQLGCPIIETSALRKTGLDELMDMAGKVAKEQKHATSQLKFDPDVEAALQEVSSIIKDRVYPHLLRWYAIKLFEGEEKTIADLKLSTSDVAAIELIRTRVEDAKDDDAESIITGERYDAITDLVKVSYKRSSKGLNTTQKIDRIVTNRFLGIIIFLIVMGLVYHISVNTVGTIATDWANEGVFGDGWHYAGGEEYEAAMETWEEAGAIEADEPDPHEYGVYVDGVPVYVESWLDAIDAAPWVKSLVIDGIIAGVGAVLGFVPQLIVLFLLLTLLEGCGYMARVAFIMDRIFRRFGLSGKSFIPMLIASGCGVPAVMATKTIENENDRRMTIVTTTMIPCGAKMPIIALVFGAIAAGDSSNAWWVTYLFYVLGVVAIIISGIMLKKLKMFAGETSPFVMELPQYHLPALKNVLLGTWERVKSFIVKAGTIIFISSVVIWFLLNFGFYEGSFGLLDSEMEGYLQYSLMAFVGNGLAWLFMPLGFGSWEATVTSVTGLVAKENVVATVGIITSLGELAETDPVLWQGFAAMLGNSVPVILAFTAFNLLCAPCFAAIGSIRRQMMSAKWTWFAIGYMTVFAWVIALMFYQFGGLITGEVSFNFWTVVAIVLLGAMLFQLFRPMPKYDTADKQNVLTESRDAA